MIDIYNKVYTLIKNALANQTPQIEMSAVYVNMPSKRPFVSVEEIENAVDVLHSSCNVENFADMQYVINIYTEGTKKRADGINILKLVDNALSSVGFVRTSKNEFQTQNETVYHIIARYSGIVSKDNVIYRR